LFFFPISSCNTSHYRSEEAVEFNSNPNARVMKTTFNIFINHTCNFYALVPNNWEHKGTSWFKAQTTLFFLNPLPHFIEWLTKSKQYIFPDTLGQTPHPIISIHVRHGDKITENPLSPLSDYMNIAKHIKETYNVSNIFLSTEDASVITEAISNYSSNFNIFYSEFPRLNVVVYQRTQLFKNGKPEVLDALLNFFIASECDIFIGTRSSNFNRLIDERRKILGRGGIPYFSPTDDVHHESYGTLCSLKWFGSRDKDIITKCGIAYPERYYNICF